MPVLDDRQCLDSQVGFRISQALLAIATLDLSSMVQFYTAILSRDPSIFQPGQYAQYDLPGLCLGLFQAKPERWPEFAESQHSPLSLCLQIESLDAAIASLTHLGAAPPSSILKADHGREIYAYDPDGNRLILWSIEAA